MEKYAVKLLFQYRVGLAEKHKMRTCEEKTVLFFLENIDEDIIKVSTKRAKKDEYNYRNDNNDTVHYEFVGIVDICHLGIETEEDEVWYDIKTLLTPMERKDTILPSQTQLQKRIHFD